MEFRRDIDLCVKQCLWLSSIFWTIFKTGVISPIKVLDLVSVLVPCEVLSLREMLFCFLEWVPFEMFFTVCERNILRTLAAHNIHIAGLVPFLQPGKLLPLTDCMFFFGNELSKLRPVDSDLHVEVKLSLYLGGYLYLFGVLLFLST